MKIAYCLGLAAGLVLAGCSGGSDQPAKATNATSSASSPSDAPGYLGALGKAQQSAVKTADVASLTQSIQSFSVDKGRYPKDLDELVQEKYLSKLPAPPYGMKYSYDAANGTLKVVKE